MNFLENKELMRKILILITTLLLVLSSCSSLDRTIASNSFLSTIDGSESITPGLKELLYEEQTLHNKDLWGENAFKSNIAPEYVPENNPKFPLPYYLIPEEKAKFLKADSLDKRVSLQLQEIINGKKYFKLFVHPESFSHYRFLKTDYTFVSQKDTEFMASPTSSYRSLLVWDYKDTKKKRFIAKVSLDKNVVGDIDRLVSSNEVERSLANQKAFDKIGSDELERIHVKIFPESAGLVLDQSNLRGAPKKLGGQIIREISDDIENSRTKLVSFSTLMSPNREPHPLIIDVIKASNLSSYDFFRKYMIEGYLNMFEELSLKKGINFEPHSQNLGFEITPDFKPTGNWALKDFGGVWPDMMNMARSDGPVEVYMEAGSATKFKLSEARGNYIGSYVYFYKRQVFDMLLDEVAKHDKTLTTQDRAKLKVQLNEMYLNKINKHLGLNVKIIPTMNNYNKTIEKLYENTKYDHTMTLSELEKNDDLLDFIEIKKNFGEYIYFNEEKPTHFYKTAYGIYAVRKDKVVGVAFLRKAELTDYNNETGKFKKLVTKIPDVEFVDKCMDIIKKFIK